jgi:hypothetical protein
MLYRPPWNDNIPVIDINILSTELLRHKNRQLENKFSIIYLTFCNTTNAFVFIKSTAISTAECWVHFHV